jgi:hypothetical protein
MKSQQNDASNKVHTITYVLRCVNDILIKTEEFDELHAIDKDITYDFHHAIFKNAIATTNVDEKKERQRKITKVQVRKLLEMQDHLCLYCLKDISKEDYHVDHMVPISFGGKTVFSNLAIACVRCNLRKSKMLFSDLTAIRAYLASKNV